MKRQKVLLVTTGTFVVFCCVNLLFQFILLDNLAPLSSGESLFHQTAPPKQTSTRRKHRELSTLQCPGNDTDAQRMVYWSDVVEPVKPVLAHHFNQQEEQFLLFDQDVAGWNNQRIGFELFALLAKLTNRTLVLPPIGATWMPFSMPDNKNAVALTTVFDSLLATTRNTISMQEFLTTQQPFFGSSIPKNRTDWSGQSIRELRPWLLQHTYPLDWRVEDCLLAIPQTPGQYHNLDRALETILRQQQQQQHDQQRHVMVDTKKLNPHTATLQDRMSQLLVFPHQSNLCVYNETLAHQKYLYYQIQMPSGKRSLSMTFTRRLLVWFYQFMLFENVTHDLAAKRWVRDALRYSDTLQCHAARIVARILMDHPASPSFYSLHIRRSAQFEHQFGTQPSAVEILRRIRTYIPNKDAILYIATDEPDDRAFFQPIMEFYHRRVYFLRDFQDITSSLPPQYHGMLDQLVAAQGAVFVGSWASTFTGFIVRMRGYLQEAAAADHGSLLLFPFHYYNAPPNVSSSYPAPRQAWFLQESPMVWEDLDD